MIPYTQHTDAELIAAADRSDSELARELADRLAALHMWARIPTDNKPLSMYSAGKPIVADQSTPIWEPYARAYTSIWDGR